MSTQKGLRNQNKKEHGRAPLAIDQATVIRPESVAAIFPFGNLDRQSPVTHLLFVGHRHVTRVSVAAVFSPGFPMS